MTTITNHTSLYSDDYSIQTHRCEFADKTEHVSISLHCDELDLEQNTKSYKHDGKSFKVKTVTAKDEKGNEVSLSIFFE